MDASLLKLTEDILLAADGIFQGSMPEDAPGDPFRQAEIIISLAERLATLAGFTMDDVWMPSEIRHLIDW